MIKVGTTGRRCGCSAGLMLGLLALALLLTLPWQPAAAAATEWVGNARAAARLMTATEATGSSLQLDAALQIRLAAGWHAYWRTPGDAGVAPSIDWQGSNNVAGEAIAWPAPRRLSLDGLETHVYDDDVVLPVAINLARPGAAATLHAEVDYAVCKDVCIPYHASLVLPVPPGLAVPGPQAALIGAARARVPGDLAAARLKLVGAAVGERNGDAVLSIRLASLGPPLRAPDLFVEGVRTGTAGRPDVELADKGGLATLRVPIRGASARELAGAKLQLTVVDGTRSAQAEAVPMLGDLAPRPGQGGRVAVFGIALLGGLVLNLMPCVLPVLSLKLLALMGYAGAERRAARLGLFATAAGVVASFGVLAAVLIVLKAAGAAIGWGIQFQLPWFLAGMALATTLFAASLWDWLQLAVPSGIADTVGSVRGRGRFTDAFLLGAFATLLAASCSAPFVGTALGFALARGPLDIALVFAALGLGMAAPFLAAACWPGLVAWLPKPGPWMAWLRRVLGLALLGTAAWLLSVLALEAGRDAALLAGGALAGLLAALAWRQALPPQRSVRRAVGALAIVFAASAVLIPSLRSPTPAPGTSSQEAASGPWRPFDTAALHGAVARGQVAFVDVTAAWCLICKVNEAAVLNRGLVAERLRDPGVLAMRADWTRPDSVVSAFLKSFGRFGVPLNVVYGPGAPEGIALPELLTPADVTDAFRRAAAAHPPEAAG